MKTKSFAHPREAVKYVSKSMSNTSDKDGTTCPREWEGDDPDEAARAASATPRGAWGGRRPGCGRKRKIPNLMGRRTWKTEVEAFVKLQLNNGAWGPSSAYERKRLLERIGQDLIKAGVRPRPVSMSVEDVQTYICWLRKDSKRNGTTQRKALILLADFLKKQTGNTSADNIRRQFPPETPSTRPRPRFQELAQGFERVKAIKDPWQRMIVHGQAALYIGTLVRPSEGRTAFRGDLNEKAWELRVRHPKGKTRERVVPFLEERCIREMEAFLAERAELLRSLGWDPEDPSLPLFPTFQYGKALKRELRHYSSQGFAKIWKLAFPTMEHYCARRGMAQEAVDNDPKKLPAVSKILGHANIQTTVKYYTEIQMSRAASELREVWKQPSEPETSPFTAPKPQRSDPAYQ